MINEHDLEGMVEDGTVITGGHFMIDEDNQPVLNQGTINSFRKAVELYRHGKEYGYQVGLGLLINDIGSICNTNSCSIVNRNFSKKDFSLPEEYVSILLDIGIEKEEVDLYWEKTMRNRGQKMLRKEVKKGNSLIEQFGEDYWITDRENYGNIMLTRAGGNNKYGNVACPLIMGAFTFEQQRRGYSKSLNLYYIGEDNSQNIPNAIVIDKGKRVAELLEKQIKVNNVYFTENYVKI
ncbi:MAG: hypothetical protein KJ896_00260, partial [Nanoarchaeota archaeon]|nr:hypothetical protein [Nanoarchaeota archaeon]